ncbi:hypothetical protein C0993_009133 [Termitomyces sp. T159_Od127]|nr:hypothetical protein C0993_009133 [Termitomyces sp. T159_Od127]
MTALRWWPKANAQLDKICEVHDEFEALLKLVMAQIKQFYDVWVDEVPNYVVEDHIYLEQADLRLDCLNHKLGFKKFSLFQITQKISDMMYQLALLDGWLIHNVFYVLCLVPACEDTILGRQQDLLPPVQMESGEEVKIE